jgi:hypothetical protein
MPYNQNWVEHFRIVTQKYGDIIQYCLDDCKVQSSVDEDFPIISEKNILKLRPNHNLFHFQILNNSNMNFRIDILFYYDWFPHLADFILIPNNHQKNFKILYYLIFENQKPNARNWDLFDNNEKVEMIFNEFLIYLISKYKIFKKYFMTKEESDNLKCNQCKFKLSKFVQVTPKLNLCQKYQQGRNLLESKNQCLNFQKLKKRE